MIKVITYGSYQVLHKGHIRILQRAKSLGDYLIVGLSTDDFNKQKGKENYQEFLERKEIIESIRYVDLVIPETNWEQKEEDVAVYGIDVFVMGDDWQNKFDHLKEVCEVVYLPRTEGVSTTEIIKNIQDV